MKCQCLITFAASGQAILCASPAAWALRVQERSALTESHEYNVCEGHLDDAAASIKASVGLQLLGQRYLLIRVHSNEVNLT